MLFFLYLGTLGAIIFLLFLFALENKKMNKRKVPRQARFNYMKKRLFSKLMLSCIFLILISKCVPWIIWTKEEKEIVFADRIDAEKGIYPLMDVEGTKYLGQVDDNGKTKYVVTVMGQDVPKSQVFDAQNVEIIEINGNGSPRYQKIDQYKRVRIKKPGIVYESVNDIYGFGYSSGWQETLVKERYKIYIPKNSIKQDYKMDNKK